MEVDPEKAAEVEAANAEAAKEAIDAAKAAGEDPSTIEIEQEPKPDPEKQTRTVNVASEARLSGVNEAGNYFNITLDLNGVTKVEVMEEPPPEEEVTPAATKTTTKSSSSSSSSSS